MRRVRRRCRGSREQPTRGSPARAVVSTISMPRPAISRSGIPWIAAFAQSLDITRWRILSGASTWRGRTAFSSRTTVICSPRDLVGALHVPRAADLACAPRRGSTARRERRPEALLGRQDPRYREVEALLGQHALAHRAHHRLDRHARIRREHQDVGASDHGVDRRLAHPDSADPLHLERVGHDQPVEAELAAQQAGSDRRGERRGTTARVERRHLPDGPTSRHRLRRRWPRGTARARPGRGARGRRERRQRQVAVDAKYRRGRESASPSSARPRRAPLR